MCLVEKVPMCPISRGLRTSQPGDRMMFLLMGKLFNEIFSQRAIIALISFGQ